MNIETIHRKKGTIYRARVGSGLNRQSCFFSRKADAQKWIVQIQAEQVRELPLESVQTDLAGKSPSVEKGSVRQSISFLELFKLFQEGYADIYQEPSTRSRELEISEKHLDPHFGSQDVHKLRSEDIQKYLYQEAKIKERKPATINKHYQVIHKVFAWALKKGILFSNPATGVLKLPERDAVYSPDFKFLEANEVFSALNKAREVYPKEFPIILTAATTGMRVGEVCALRREDLLDSIALPVFLVRRTYCRTLEDFKNTTKGGNARTVPVGDQLLELLKPLAAAKKKEDLLFFGSLEEAKQVRNILHKKWMRAQKLCGLRPRSFHALRHTFATLFLSHGGASFALQRILGHSNARITDKYSHFSRSLVENSRNLIQLPANATVQPKAAG